MNIRNKAPHKKYEHHPLSEMFPIREGSIESQAEHIKSSGLLQPIVLFEDKILDGRKRQESCRIAKIDPRFTVFKGSTMQAMDYVFGANFPFSNLTQSQRTCVAAAYLDMKTRVTKEIGYTAKDYKPRGRLSVIVAKQFNIGSKALEQARWIMNNHPKKFQKIKSGELKINSTYQSLNPDVKPYVALCIPKHKRGMYRSLDVIDDMAKNGWNFSYTRKGDHHYGAFWTEKCGLLNVGHSSFAECVKLAAMCAQDKAEVAA